MSFISEEMAKAVAINERMNTRDDKAIAIQKAKTEHEIAKCIVSVVKMYIHNAIIAHKQSITCVWYREADRVEPISNQGYISRTIKGGFKHKCTDISLEEYKNSAWGVWSFDTTFERVFEFGLNQLNCRQIQEYAEQELNNLGVKQATVYIGYHDHYISETKKLFITRQERISIPDKQRLKIYVEASW